MSAALRDASPAGGGGRPAVDVQSRWLGRLSQHFGDVSSSLLLSVLQRHRMDAQRAFEELAEWAPVELKRPTHIDGHELFTWRLPIERLRREGAGVQVSSEFERDGDVWRLKVHPTSTDDGIAAYVMLAGKSRAEGYSVRRCFRLLVLHPTDPSQVKRNPSDGPNRFDSSNAWGTDRLVQVEDVDKFTHKGWMTVQAMVWRPEAGPVAAGAGMPQRDAPAVMPQARASEAHYSALLRKTFPTTPLDVLLRVLDAHEGDGGRAFAEMALWSPTELQQASKDDKGRKIHTWRVPLEDWRRAGKKDTQYSAEFEGDDGDVWRWQLRPIGADGHVSVFIELTAKNKEGGWGEKRAYTLRALHPTDPNASRTMSGAQMFRELPCNWGFGGLLTSDNWTQFLHNGWLTLQAVLWKPPQSASQPPQQAPEDAKPDSPTCVVCVSRAPTVLLRCCNTVRTCETCVDTLMRTPATAKCPLCRAEIDEDKAIRGIRL